MDGWGRFWFRLLAFSALVPALVLHEVAHGLAALWCGDPTAKERGRLSLNPLRHVDPFMSVVLPALLALSGSRVLFGGAKPVPIDLERCRNPIRAYWIVAAAGPLCNFLQALAGTGALQLIDRLWPDELFVDAVSLVCIWLYLYVTTNVALMVFNLLPIPPLDGSRIVTAALPGRLRAAYAGLERWGMLIVFAFLYFGQTNRLLGRAIEAVRCLLGFDGVFD